MGVANVLAYATKKWRATTINKLLRRVGTAVLTGGACNLVSMAKGDIDGKTAAANIAQELAATAIGMLPEKAITPGVANFIGQVSTDFVFDLVTDVKLRDRLKDQSFAEWFMREELPQLVASVAFAGQDLQDKGTLRGQQKAIRALYKKGRGQVMKDVAKVTPEQIDESNAKAQDAQTIAPTKPDPEAVARASQEMGAAKPTDTESSLKALQDEIDAAAGGTIDATKPTADMTLPELRAEAKRIGVSAGGASKAALRARIEKAGDIGVTTKPIIPASHERVATQNELDTPTRIEALRRSELRAMAEERGVKTSPNTPNPKLREKIAEAGPSISEDGQEVHGPRNIIINREREQMGLPPREDVVKKSLPQSYEGAQSKLESDSNAGRKVIDDIRENNRPHTDEEVALMGVELVNRKHEWHKALDAYNNAPEGSKAEALRKSREAAEYYREAADVVQRAGTETARGLNARRLLIKDDLTLEDMIFERQAMKGGQLSRNELDAIKGESDAIDKAQDKVAETDKKRSVSDIDKLIKKNRGKKNRGKKDAPTMEEARSALLEKGPTRKQLRDLARAHISNGVKDVTDLTLKLWEDVREITGTEMSSNEIRTTLSNYGQTSIPSQDAVEKKLRELTSLSRLISSTEDALKGEPPKRTGPQRDKPTQSVREQAAYLRDVMREKGIKVGGDRGDKLATRLNAMKTRLKNRVADLNKQIELGVRTQPDRTPVMGDAEVDTLRAEVARLDELMTEIERSSGVINDREEARSLKSLDKQIERYLKMIETGSVAPEIKTGAHSAYSKAISDRKSTAKLLRNELSDFRKQRDLPQDSPGEKALAKLKKRIAREAAEYQRRMDEGDFAPKKRPKSDVVMDKEASKARSELNDLKMAYARANAKYQFDQMGAKEKVTYHALSIMDAFRTMKSSFDFSALRRQGGLYLLAHPIKGLQAARAGGIALRSDADMERMSNEIKSRANYDKYNKYKIGLADMEGAKAEEEYFIREHGIGKGVEKIPGIQASQRSYTATLNRMRADMFDGLEGATQIARKGLHLRSRITKPSLKWYAIRLAVLQRARLTQQFAT